MDEKILKKYAALAVRNGVNVRPGQPLVITAAVQDAPFVRMCAEEAYSAGASKVTVRWTDETLTHMGYEHQSVETLTDIPDWITERERYEQGQGVCYLHIESDTPGFMGDVDQEKIRQYRLAAMKKLEPYQTYTINNIGQWSIVAVPGRGWAKKVFPDLPEDEAVEALGDAILYASRVLADNDPAAEWKRHDEELEERCRILNGYQFSALHFTNSLGTDLTVGLVKDHIWAGGRSFTPEGVAFNANIPTEECFCMPDRLRVDGKVFASMPLDLRGTLVKDFWFEFKDGKVADHSAAEGLEALDGMLETDEGSTRLGEVALVPYESPISKQGILYFNTLFDENASCHLALGRCYPENIRGGEEMEPDELLAAGGNYSMNHVDFMFGTADMNVTGIGADGSQTPVFRNGNFVF